MSSEKPSFSIMETECRTNYLFQRLNSDIFLTLADQLLQNIHPTRFKYSDYRVATSIHDKIVSLALHCPLLPFQLFSKHFTLYGCNLFQALRFHFKAEILTFPVLSTLFLFTSIWEFQVSMPKHARNSVFSWCHSVTRLFRKS